MTLDFLIPSRRDGNRLLDLSGPNSVLDFLIPSRRGAVQSREMSDLDT